MDLPDHAITTLLNETITFTAETTTSCVIENNLVSTDGRLVAISPSQIAANTPTNIEIMFNSAAQHNSKARMIGNLSCNSEVRDFDIEILSLSIIPLDGLFNSKISVSNRDNIAIPIDSIGTGSHTFSYLIDGPLSRIADSQQTQDCRVRFLPRI